MKRRAFPLLLLAGFLAATSALSQETKTSRQAVEKRLHDVEKEKVYPAIEQAIHSLAAASGFTQAVVSPDGKKVAWVEELRDKNGAESGNSLIFTTTIDGKGPARKITASSGTARAESDIAWSPDSRGFAFLSDAAKPGQLQLYLQSAPGQPAKRLTNVKGFLASPKFSPDGKTIAVLFTENATRAAGPLVAETPETGDIYKPALQINFPAWSPDGKSIAFIEGLMSDFGSVGGDIFLMPATGEKPQNLTPERKASTSWLTWTKDGKIIAGEYAQGDSSVISLDPSTSKIDSLYRAEDLVSTGTWGPSVSVSDDGKISAAVRRSFSAAPEIWAGPIGNWKQITQRNKGVTAAWGQAKSIRWKSDSYDVQGWLIYPANFDSSKKYPMVVAVHGGPSAAVLSAWPGSGDFALALAASGYFVLMPNPRGSFGQGEGFTHANVRDFGYGDLRDILSGVDEALKTAPIDSNRLGITGWSYGGYMTMWAVTQTNRFKAAMAGAGIANYQSYYGENKIDQWMIPFFGKSVYDDPDVYAKSSPITFIKQVKTPTLVIVGDSDGECPTPQSYEFWHALKTLGVETQLVVYEHEGHHFAKPEHQRDRIRRTVAWFDAHLSQP